MHNYFILLALLSVAASTKYCAHFEFTSLTDAILRGTEGRDVNVTFVLNTTSDGCSNVSIINLDRFATPFCKFRLDSHLCIPTPNNSTCGCSTMKGILWFAKVLDKSDNTTWTLRALDDDLKQVGVQQFAVIIKDFSGKCQSENHCPDSDMTETMCWTFGGILAAVVVTSFAAAVICSKRRLISNHTNFCESLTPSQYEEDNAVHSDDGVNYINNIYVRSGDMRIATTGYGAADVYVDVVIDKE